MPFYEYECSRCKYAAEVLQKITDAPLRKCPSCGKASFKRLVSAPVFRLKGSGWYETDFKSDKERQRNLAGAEREAAKAATESPPAAAGASTEASTEARPAAKTESAPVSRPQPAVKRRAAVKRAATKSRTGGKRGGRRSR